MRVGKPFGLISVYDIWEMCLWRFSFHPHALERLSERGASKAEVIATVETGESSPAKFGRTMFRRNFPFEGTWRGRKFTNKQVEVYAVQEEGDWLVITVITRYY